MLETFIWVSTATFGVALILVYALWYWRRPTWMGFANRTLWDWTELLAVPVGLGLGTLIITQAQMEVERVRTQEAAMLSFVDRVSEVMREEEGAAMQALVRAHTIAVLQIVDGPGGGRVLRFLDEIGLLRDFTVSLEGRDLRGADLAGVDLSGWELEEANLAGIELEGAILRGTDFEEADLRRADLKGADLSGASFEDAEMSGAHLNGAVLAGADLSTAKGLTSRQIAAACHDDTTRLPPGFDPPARATVCGGDYDEGADDLYDDD